MLVVRAVFSFKDFLVVAKYGAQVLNRFNTKTFQLIQLIDISRKA